MAGSVNRVIIVGNLGSDPEIRSFQTGDRVANFSVATSESWKSKDTGEKQSRTQWHKIAVFNQGLVGVIERYLKKGSKVYLEGMLETRKWTDQSGQEKYMTEVVLRPYRGELVMLDGKSQESAAAPASNAAPVSDPGGYMDDDQEIPFGFIIPLLSALIPYLSIGGIA